MKIRNGFVSNSSSTSYVVLFPDNFDIKTVINKDTIKKSQTFRNMLNWNKNKTEDSLMNSVMKETIQSAQNLMEDKWVGLDGNGAILQDLLGDYVIAEVDGGADDRGAIKIADKKKIKSILGVK